MSSAYDKPADLSKAEEAYWDAFDRLRMGRPTLLRKGTEVTQNNVARECDRDPSALRKARFPRVIRAIQRYVEEQSSDSEPSKRQEEIAGREKKRGLREQLAACRAQRDIAVSRLIEADAKILELTMENLRLQSINDGGVSKLPGPKG